MFARVTEPNGVVHWINLDHVRELVVKEGKVGTPTLTQVNIDNHYVAKVFTVTEAPEDILARAKG